MNWKHYSIVQKVQKVLKVESVFLLGTLGTLLTLLSGCANRGVGPQGGPRDSLPPVVIKADPVNGTLQFKKKDRKIELTFDEYIQLNNVSQNLLISPPQQITPDVKVVGKRVSLTFAQPLADSTTYTLEWGQAVCDYHEQVPLPVYTYSFSTGDWIDSLYIEGYVVQAEDLNPISGIIVGVHRDRSDAAFSTTPFQRIARTDSLGWFRINNLAPGQYRLFALRDMNSDYLYQPTEGLAFMDTIIAAREPNDSVSEEVLLWYFMEDNQRTYFQRCKREQAHVFQMMFSQSLEQMPELRSLHPSQMDSTRTDSAWVDWMAYTHIHMNPKQDTLVVWLLDSVAIAQDTLWMEMTYLKSDSLGHLFSHIDTVSAVYHAPKLSAKAKKMKAQNMQQVFLPIRSNTKTPMDVYKQVVISFSSPIDTVCLDGLSLWTKVDSTYTAEPFTAAYGDSTKLTYTMSSTWHPEANYELRVDSATFMDVYGHVNKATKWTWKMQSIEAYSTLTVRLKHFMPQARIQLLDKNDHVVRDEPALAEGTLFQYLSPDTYYMRMYIDRNSDGRWTTGDWKTHRQPEPVYYFPSKLTLRANWDFEEEFDHLALPQLDSKPQALVKDAATATKK